MAKQKTLNKAVNFSEEVLQQTLNDYLAKRMTFQEFQDWFVPTTWDLDESSPLALQKLVYRIELLMAEYTGAYWTEDEFRKRLAAEVYAFR